MTQIKSFCQMGMIYVSISANAIKNLKKNMTLTTN